MHEKRKMVFKKKKKTVPSTIKVGRSGYSGVIFQSKIFSINLKNILLKSILKFVPVLISIPLTFLNSKMGICDT